MPKAKYDLRYQGYTIKGKPCEGNCILVIDDKSFEGLPESVLNLLLVTSKERDYYRDLIEYLEDPDIMKITN